MRNITLQYNFRKANPVSVICFLRNLNLCKDSKHLYMNINNLFHTKLCICTIQIITLIIIINLHKLQHVFMSEQQNE